MHHRTRRRLEYGGLGLLGAAALVSVGLTFAGGPGREPRPVADKVARYYANPPTPTVASESPLKVTPADQIRQRVTGTAPLTVSIFGDSTGNDADEWVELWAKDLAANATVTVNHWKESARVWPVTSYGKAARSVAIWNGSEPGSTGAYARQRFEAMQPVKPDLIIYSYGHNASPAGAAGDIDALQRMAESRWGVVPFVVTLQNASRGIYQAVSAKSVADLKTWAEPRHIPTLNIETVIRAQNLDALLLDEVHPNKQGSRLWADKVVEVLG